MENSFNGGVDVGAMEIDQSTALVRQQVSLPMMNGDGQVIGSIIYEPDVNAMR